MRLLMICIALTFGFLAAAPAQAEDLVLEKWFAGRTVATGRFSAINGVRRDFTVKLTGTWNGRTFTLREDFVYDDKTRDTKTWRFRKTGANRYLGTREDVVGETDVKVVGDTARFTYQVYLDPKDRKSLVRFYDTMRLKGDGTVINTAWVTKWGLPVGRTRVEFRR